MLLVIGFALFPSMFASGDPLAGVPKDVTTSAVLMLPPDGP
jgi:hypothetical protein